MASFTHKAARLAFSKALDVLLDRVYKDREKGLTEARSSRRIHSQKKPTRCSASSSRIRMKSGTSI